MRSREGDQIAELIREAKGAWDRAYDLGVRAGYLKARAEQLAERIKELQAEIAKDDEAETVQP